MPAHDSNNATWFMLRYATDFTPRAASAIDPAPPEFVPAGAPALFFDESREVLELLPVSPAQATPPLPGLAVDLSGEIYRVDSATGQLVRQFCDGSQMPLVCEPGVLRAPAGLALDRRGFLYIADPLLARVIVLRPEDGSSVAILFEDLTQPVDVAVAPDGRIYVADLAGGRIAVFDPRFRRLCSFASQPSVPLPSPPAPVAVMIDADGTLLVADANYPRLLRFGPSGTPLGDVSLAAQVAPLLASGLSLDDPLALLNGSAARFIAGSCRPPWPDADLGVKLALLHRELRLLALHLNHAYPPNGIVLSAALDAVVPGTIWHKLVLDAELPPGTWITVETATSDDVDGLVSVLTGASAGTDLPWSAPASAGEPIAFTREVPDQLIQSPPGRFLRLRITMGSDGTATPSLRWLKVIYPRVSYLASLPRIYQRDPDAALFLQHYLALFERVLTGVEDARDRFSRRLDPRAAPLDIIDWLGLLVDLSFDPSWPLAKRRALVGAAMELYRTRGTIAGLELYVQIYTGTTPVIRELFLDRPGQPAFVGLGSGMLGGNFALTSADATQTPSEALIASYAHRFQVTVYPADDCEAETLLPVVDRIITANKPAHTIHTLVAVYPDARIGTQDTIGIDLVIGDGMPSRQGDSGLGVETVLRDARPPYGPAGFTLP